MRRVVSVWFPQWGIQHRCRERPELKGRPLMLFEGSGARSRVTECSLEAVRNGVRPGMPLAETRALFPSGRDAKNHPCWLPEDSQQDQRALRGLLPLFEEYSPVFGLDDRSPFEGVFLETAGCAHLFGGEAGLLTHLQGSLEKRGFQVRLAMADTMGAAWGAAHYARSSITLIESDQQVFALRPLPLPALRIEEGARLRFQKLGVTSIDQFLKLPRASLPSRFGADLLRRWDQACGDFEEHFTPERLTAPLTASWDREEEIRGPEQLEYVWRILLESLLGPLVERHLGIQEMSWGYRGELGKADWKICLLTPATDIKYLLQLLHLKLEKHALPESITAIRLEVPQLARLRERRETLFDTDPEGAQEREYQRLVERLSLRLGMEAILQPELVSDPQPEYACRLTPALKAASHFEESVSVVSAVTHRPLRQLDPPELVETISVVPDGPPVTLWWKNHQERCLRWWGPERIETGWWRERDVKRDYYRVETDREHCLWIFRCRESGCWYLHGWFE